MDKPISMSVKDFLIRTLAVKMLTSEKTIEAVINHQFQSANEALDLNNSVEIAGFGKFFFNSKKATKRIEQLKINIGIMEKIIADPSTSDQKKKSSQLGIDKALKTINELKTKTTYEH
jgi:nucleoid DNA-binding protein